MKQHSHKGWIACDLDRTLAHYDKYQGSDHIGEPIEPMVELVKFWLESGEDVRIFTARVWVPPEPNMRDLEDHLAAHVAIENFCMAQFGKRLPITCTKDPKCKAIYDDLAFHVEPNTGRVLLEPFV